MSDSEERELATEGEGAPKRNAAGAGFSPRRRVMQSGYATAAELARYRELAQTYYDWCASMRASSAKSSSVSASRDDE